MEFGQLIWMPVQCLNLLNLHGFLGYFEIHHRGNHQLIFARTVKDPKLLDVHLVQKGSNIHEALERKAMSEKEADFIIVLDQGSRGAPPVVDDADTKSIVIDHHLSDDFPEGAEVSKSIGESCLCSLNDEI
tara:strand:+ start:145 stop:537 length:393 start_codon:yes stop_codon:yes gene_type:complete